MAYERIGFTEDRCIYPQIRGWLNRNQYSLCRLAFEIYGENNDCHRIRLAKALKGDNCQKRDIDGILKLTKMKYEQAFNTV